MKALLTQLRARPHLSLSAGIGGIVVLATPASTGWMLRLLIGWNVAVWLYLIQAFWVMSRADHHHLRRAAIAQAEGATAVLGSVTAAALASVAAIVFELAAAKGPDAHHAWPHAIFAIVTVTGSWLLLPTLFALNYASLFHISKPNRGLVFPGENEETPTTYWDFLYFSFTIAVASQTADVAISSSAMRRLVLMQSLLSFMFNTTILALTVNIAASLF